MSASRPDSLHFPSAKRVPSISYRTGGTKMQRVGPQGWDRHLGELVANYFRACGTRGTLPRLPHTLILFGLRASALLKTKEWGPPTFSMTTLLSRHLLSQKARATKKLVFRHRPASRYNIGGLVTECRPAFGFQRQFRLPSRLENKPHVGSRAFPCQNRAAREFFGMESVSEICGIIP